MRGHKNTEATFWSYVKRVESCWLWLGSDQGTGYGMFRFNGEKQLAHRLAYEFIRGPIPDGLQLDHLCRVRRCVNPAHLEPVSQRENLIRGEGWAGKNARKTTCNKGHALSVIPNNLGKRGCLTCRKAVSDLSDIRKRERKKQERAQHVPPKF